MIMETQLPPKYMPEVSGSRRLMSAFIDYLPMFCLSLLTIPFIFLSMSNLYTIDHALGANVAAVSVFESMKNMFLYLSIFMVISYEYFLCKDLFGGRSIGKRSQGLQLVRCKANGPVSNARMVVRNLFILIWIVEVIMYFANPRQRLGDIVCDTTVVPADESNRQPYDGKKVALTMLIVFVGVCLFALLYYKAMCLYFDFVIQTIENASLYQ